MKKITTLVAALLLSVATFAQAPQGFSYQAVVRDAQNAIVANQTVDVDITITAEVDGTAVQTYTEKHSVTTNANGLLTLVVGQGESSQKLSDIKWSMPGAIYNMRTETKYGTATTQLLSVPFAMYAEQAGELDYQKLAKTLSSSDVQELLGYVKAEDLEAIRKCINDSLAAYGNTYIKKTDVNVLTKNYVTKEYFENYVVSGGTTDSVDLSVYAKKTDLPNMSNYVQMRMLDYYSDTINQIRSEYAKKNFVAENYVTKEAFDNYVLSGGDAESVDLTVYAKTADVENTYAKKADIPSLSGYALKSDIPTMPTVPTKVSELQNDANYLTSHQDISGKQDVIDDLDDIRSGAALGATALQSHQSLAAYAKTADVDATYAKKTDLNAKANTADLADVATSGDYNDLTNKPTLATVATSGNYTDLNGKPTLATVATTGSYNDLTNKPTIPTVPTATSQLTADKIGDMPMATVNVVITNNYSGRGVDAIVSFLGQELTSGTTTFKIPAYSPVFLSVSLSKYSNGNKKYSYTVNINGKPFDPVTGYYYAIYPSNPRNLKIAGVTGTPGPEDVLSGDYYGTFSESDLRVVKTPIYKTGSGKSLELPAHWHESDFSAGHAPVVTDADLAMVNQIVGPFPNATNTIEIIVNEYSVYY